MTDSREAEQLIAGIYHHARSEAKKARKGKPKGDAPMHHRAGTNWWDAVKW